MPFTVLEFICSVLEGKLNTAGGPVIAGRGTNDCFTCIHPLNTLQAGFYLENKLGEA